MKTKRGRLPPWSQSIKDEVLKRLSPEESEELEHLVLREAEVVLDEGFAWGDQVATEATQCDMLLPTHPSRPWRSMSKQQKRALVRSCALMIHHVCGQRIGDRYHRADPFLPNKADRGWWIPKPRLVFVRVPRRRR